MIRKMQRFDRIKGFFVPVRWRRELNGSIVGFSRQFQQEILHGKNAETRLKRALAVMQAHGVKVVSVMPFDRAGFKLLRKNGFNLAKGSKMIIEKRLGR